MSARILSRPDFNLPFIVETTASNHGFGSVLIQRQGDEEKVIYYLSNSLTTVTGLKKLGMRNYFLSPLHYMSMISQFEHVVT